MGDDIGSHENLPPGFRFCPTDEELVLHFLYHKVFLLPCHPNIIPDIDICLHDPWELNGMALSSGNVHYFFSKVKQDRVTANGFWKELDIDEPIFTSSGNKVGVKKYLVFYINGESETNWVMEEFNLCHNSFTTTTAAAAAAPAAYNKRQRKQKLMDCIWVLCRVHERKDITDNSLQTFCHDDDDGTELSCLDEVFFSLLDDDLEEISLQR